MKEALTLALEAIEELRYSSSTFKSDKLSAEAITAIKEALAQPDLEADIEQLIEERDVREYVLDKVLDMVLSVDRPEWSSSYQYIDAVEDVREALAQPEERNFCPRCGKRTADLTTIHTCTPPMGKT